MDSRSGTALCQICQREFSDEDELVPRILTECGHTLCTSCAKQILAGQKRILCPFDRIPTDVPEGDVRKLKKNFTILQMKEEEKFRRKLTIMSAKKDKRKRKGDGTCDENPTHRAASFCKSCDADLCDECWDWVHSLAILAHHEKTQMFDKPIDAPNCSVHILEKADFVCKDRKCKDLQMRLMCHVCFREEGSKHFNHGYVPLQSEVADIRTKMHCSLSMAEQKEMAIMKNIEKLEEVIQSHSTDGSQFNDKILEVKRFWHIQATDEVIYTHVKNAVEGRIDILLRKIANCKVDVDWIKKTKANVERLMLYDNIRLVQSRFQVDIMINGIEKAVVRHPKSLAKCGMCEVHVTSLNPFKIEMKPTRRLELRDNSSQVIDYIKKRNPTFGYEKNRYRHKTNFFRIAEHSDDMKFFSEGLSMIIVVDPFNGDLDSQCGALELLENAPAYENIVVGLTPFNFKAVSTFLSKLVDIGRRDSRIQIVYMNDEEDIERMVDLSLR